MFDHAVYAGPCTHSLASSVQGYARKMLTCVTCNNVMFLGYPVLARLIFAFGPEWRVIPCMMLHSKVP